jgi:hypothetical protein
MTQQNPQAKDTFLVRTECREHAQLVQVLKEKGTQDNWGRYSVGPPSEVKHN